MSSKEPVIIVTMPKPHNNKNSKGCKMETLTQKMQTDQSNSRLFIRSPESQKNME